MVARRPRGAGGLLIALAVIIKPYAMLFVPWLAAQRAMRALAAAAAGTLAALAAAGPLYGWTGTIALHRDWWRTVTESTAPNLLNADNVSLAAMYAKWIGSGSVSAALAAGTAAALLAIAALIFLQATELPRPEGLEAALLLTLIPLLSPQGWDYVFLIATPAVMYLVNYDRDLPSALRLAAWLALAIVAFTLYDVMGRRAYGYFMAWSVVSVCYLVLIGGDGHAEAASNRLISWPAMTRLMLLVGVLLAGALCAILLSHDAPGRPDRRPGRARAGRPADPRRGARRADQRSCATSCTSRFPRR